ncbi:MAG: tetratricopeptide repeat protein [Campylobacterota bacterium]|nr:tetratricopeptide repeat protein [Campylobacterota bacterium]
MAEAQEDIIIIEDSEAAEVDDQSTQDDLPVDEESTNKKKIIIFSAIAVLLVAIIVIMLVILLKSSKSEELLSTDLIEEKLQEEREEPIETSKLEDMIAKANYLYSSGSKDEALFLYEKIAHYSEAISQYNLGVAQLKNKQYQLALNTFQKAIKNDEKRCVSAINAAVCSLHLDDKESFKYYIDLAHAYLPHEINSPLYSYYYSLISYYNNNYLEALSALKNSTSNEYPYVHKNLSAKINALFGNDYDAIEAMEKNFQEYDDFSMALLYARVGDFTLAINHLNEAILKNIEPAKAQLALGLINLKAGRIANANKEIKNVTDMFPEEVYKHYPIKVNLKDSLFDPKKAQKAYRKNIASTKNLNYQKIFYFSPYKIFNANQTISYIRKGNANIYIDNVESAKEYLEKSASSSNVNIGITKAIKKALSFKIREANQELQKLVKIQPKHSILHYNLALTYAQMGNLVKANSHFVRSYHLDAKNYLSGVYAVLTGQIINKENYKLTSILKDSIANEEPSEETNLYQTLLYISENNFLSAVDWLDNDYKQRPLYLALDIIISLKLNMLNRADKSATKLTILLPNDIVPHMMYIDANYSELKTLQYASKVLSYLKKQEFNFNDLYFGPYITRYLYIQQNLITGQLYFLREQLKEVLETTSEYTHEIESALALASLYDKQFEESYTLYNHLIDEMKIRDAYTLFLGAVASTAAKHHENAIALLELSKMKDGSFSESRYALALLYLEIKNNRGASVQLSRIHNDSFTSKFFDFEIDHNQLHLKKITKKNNQ